jgi:hypothetical protein
VDQLESAWSRDPGLRPNEAEIFKNRLTVVDGGARLARSGG